MSRIQRLTVTGDHREIGTQLGVAAATAFRDVVPTIERYRALERDWLGSARLKSLEDAGRAAFPDYMAELEGIAQGARTAFERVFLWNCRGDLPGGGDQTAGSLGCTSFLYPIGTMAHNEDDQYELRDQCFFVSANIAGGTGFHSFYSPGLLPGHTFAVSNRGLVQTINHLRTLDQKPGVPRHLTSRAVLDAESLDDAISILETTDRAGGFHHNLGMAGDRRLFSVEAPATGFVVRQAVNPLAHANHLVTDELSGIEQTVAPSSGARQRRADELLAGSQERIPEPKTALGDSAGGEYPIYRKVHAGADPGYTLASVIFELSDEAVQFAVYSDLAATPEHSGAVQRHRQ